MKKGYCNCKTDRYSRSKWFIGNTYSSVRVDKDGLCYLCANTALLEPYRKPPPSNHDYWKDREDITVSTENPEGVFNYDRR